MLPASVAADNLWSSILVPMFSSTFAPQLDTRPMGRVLIVDDDPATRHLHQQMLAKAGFAVLTAESGSAGLRLLAGERHIRVVLLDLEMPGCDGWDFRRVQQADPQLAKVPAVIVTATSLVNVVDAQLHAADYILKPVAAEHLISVVAKYCERPFLHAPTR